VHSARVAANDFPKILIRVIDTQTIGSPPGTIVHIVAEMAQSGADIDEIGKRIHNLTPRCRVYFLVDTLEYLGKGGRIGGALKLLGGIMKVKPILALKNGRVDQYERERTNRRAVARLKQIILEQVPRRTNAYLTIIHAGVHDNRLALAHDLAGKMSIIQHPHLQCTSSNYHPRRSRCLDGSFLHLISQEVRKVRSKVVINATGTRIDFLRFEII